MRCKLLLFLSVLCFYARAHTQGRSSPLLLSALTPLFHKRSPSPSLYVYSLKTTTVRTQRISLQACSCCHRRNHVRASNQLCSLFATIPFPYRGLWRYVFFLFCTHIYFPASGQAVLTGVVHFPSRFLLPIFHRAYVGFSNPTARRFFVECC